MATAPMLPTQVPVTARFRLALRALFGSLPAGSVGSQLLSGIFPGGGQPPVRSTADYLNAYSTMPWLRAVVHRVAGAVASTQWHVYAAKGRRGKYQLATDMQYAPYAQRLALRKAASRRQQLDEIESHPLIDLLHKGNPMLTGINTRRLIQIHLDLVGEGFWVLGRNRYQMPVTLWPIPPTWVQELPTLKNPTYRIQFQAWHGAIPETEVVAFNDPNPANPYGRGRGTAMALGDELETDEYTAKHLKGWFYNRARPDLIITADGMQKDDTDRLEHDWLSKVQGFMKAWRPYFMNRKVEIHELSQTFESMQLSQLRRDERDIILHVFGVPPEIFGIIENSNRATIDSADYIFAKYVLVSRLEYIREVIQTRLVPEFDERLIVDYESPIQEDKEHKLKVALAAPWVVTHNEWRQMADFEHIEGPMGALVGVPINITVMPLNELGVAPELPVLPEVPEPEAEEPEEPEPDEEEHQARALQSKAPRRTSPLQRLTQRLEPQLRRQFVEVMRRLQAQTGLDDLQAALARGDIEGVVRAIPWQQLPQEMRGMATTLRQGLAASGQVAAQELSQLLETRFVFDLASPTAVASAQAQAASLVTNITESSRNAIRDAVTRHLEQGVNPRELAETIRETIGLTTSQERAVDTLRAQLDSDGVSNAQIERRLTRYREQLLTQRSKIVASHELLTAMNAGHVETWQQAVRSGDLNPTQWRKTVLGTTDDRQCTICRGVGSHEANQDLGLDGLFMLGNGAMASQPPFHVGCRDIVSLRRR